MNVIEAQESHLDSLQTIVPRAFHPTNPYIRKVFPDTPLIRQWWRSNFAKQLANPACAVLVVVDPCSETTVKGLLTLKRMEASEHGSGSWTANALTPDHDQEAFRPMIDGMTAHRERIMLGTRHYMIELFGVEHGAKGQGIGGRLLRRACEIADQSRLPTFVQSNMFAWELYARFGFEERGSEDMPGDEGYREIMMVRECEDVGEAR
ncbi:hypothetical protein KC343_g5114 [Hortaea werneckii]|uniref:N-acetyltransferase domain-containing protein n=1 Tax=Hortaea werneckii TaxID=91943 RepID=A0A3M7F285_HORWE|nr:hypothetical protein KC352_g23086 [Hortaea werneckii]KAI7565632.1 hypothetical protein KC317_g6235 [Hortaea werneckii]KAI7608670.1 hypothetical protein KC346_g9515 [Hortaea werneckii]KAI7629633.1 hypothetical protein KC343_g5114 [Hortaea werneckii]KAI7651899.1 hypothetical protein KC319_g10788 [Hortaea werneckii]